MKYETVSAGEKERWPGGGSWRRCALNFKNFYLLSLRITPHGQLMVYFGGGWGREDFVCGQSVGRRNI